MQHNTKPDLKKDIEDIRVIHRKCLAIIFSCVGLPQMKAAETYNNLAAKLLRSRFPNKHIYRDHNKILDMVFKNIDICLTLKRRQLRMS